ncbi:hypothetical protein SNE40_011239 [Patella caerulea]
MFRKPKRLLFCGLVCLFLLMVLFIRSQEQGPFCENLTDEQNRVAVNFQTSVVGEILKERRRNLLQFCANKELLKAGNSSEKITRGHFVYDIKHKFVYCAAEKAGSTFWRRLYQIIAGLSNKKSPFDIHSDSALSGDQKTFRPISFDFIHALLQESVKFVIARDPFSRLFSGFANKLFEVNPSFWATVGRIVIRNTRKNASKESLSFGHDVSFPELVKYVIMSERSGAYRDGHFIPISDHCRPCQIKYDIVAKMETLKEDTMFALQQLNMTHVDELMKTIENLDEVSELDSIINTSQHTLQRLVPSLPVSKAEGLRRTWRSFQYRGYIGKHIKYPLSKEEEGTIDNKGLTQLFQNAVKSSGSRKSRLANRQLVLQEAYGQIPLEDLLALSDIFKTDCGAFGYNCKPDYIFKPTENVQTNFLDVWSA